jgi:hypothetical protein
VPRSNTFVWSPVLVTGAHRISTLSRLANTSGRARTFLSFLSAVGCAHFQADRNVRAATKVRCTTRDRIQINLTCIACLVVINSLEQAGMGGNPRILVAGVLRAQSGWSAELELCAPQCEFCLALGRDCSLTTCRMGWWRLRRAFDELSRVAQSSRAGVLECCSGDTGVAPRQDARRDVVAPIGNRLYRAVSPVGNRRAPSRLVPLDLLADCQSARPRLRVGALRRCEQVGAVPEI